MNFEGTRTLEFTLSADNYSGELETMLRRYKVLNDNEDIVDWGHVFNDIVLKLKIKQRKAVETLDYGEKR